MTSACELNRRDACRYRAAFSRGIVMMLCAMLMALATSPAHAQLAVLGTRHIYHAEEKSLTISTRNSGPRPILVQIWMDEGDRDADPSRVSVPFVITPPVLRMDANEHVAITVKHTGESLPADRESLYWINFLNIPARDSNEPNVLKLSHRFRMKVLYRPPGLAGSASQAVDALRWTYREGGMADKPAEIRISNPSAYYVVLVGVEVQTKSEVVSLEAMTVAPWDTARVHLPVGVVPVPGPASVRFEAPSDDGTLKASTAALARNS